MDCGRFQRHYEHRSTRGLSTLLSIVPSRAKVHPVSSTRRILDRSCGRTWGLSSSRGVRPPPWRVHHSVSRKALCTRVSFFRERKVSHVSFRTHEATILQGTPRYSKILQDTARRRERARASVVAAPVVSTQVFDFGDRVRLSVRVLEWTIRDVCWRATQCASSLELPKAAEKVPSSRVDTVSRDAGSLGLRRGLGRDAAGGGGAAAHHGTPRRVLVRARVPLEQVSLVALFAAPAACRLDPLFWRFVLCVSTLRFRVSDSDFGELRRTLEHRSTCHQRRPSIVPSREPRHE